MASNALALVSGGSAMSVSGAVRLEGLGDVFKLARALAHAKGFVPKHLLGDENSIAAAILTGLELGLGPMEAMRSIDVIEGRPSMSAELMLARAIRAGVKVKWLTASSDKTRQALRLTREGETHEHEFTAAEAQAAQLTGKDNWKKYMPAMLRARCISGAMRAFCPDVLGSGVYTPDELDSAPQGASSGSPEVRILGDALHEVDEADPSAPDPFEHALHALAQCRSDADLRTWVKAFSLQIERAPDDSRRRGLWDAVKKRARAVVPPVQVALVTRWFGEERDARATPAVEITPDGEVTPAARAMFELQSVETREAGVAWAEDNRDYLASIAPGSSEERVIWKAVENRLDIAIAAELQGMVS